MIRTLKNQIICVLALSFSLMLSHSAISQEQRQVFYHWTSQNRAKSLLADKTLNPQNVLFFQQTYFLGIDPDSELNVNEPGLYLSTDLTAHNAGDVLIEVHIPESIAANSAFFKDDGAHPLTTWKRLDVMGLVITYPKSFSTLGISFKKFEGKYLSEQDFLQVLPERIPMQKPTLTGLSGMLYSCKYSLSSLWSSKLDSYYDWDKVQYLYTIYQKNFPRE